MSDHPASDSEVFFFFCNYSLEGGGIDRWGSEGAQTINVKIPTWRRPGLITKIQSSIAISMADQIARLNGVGRGKSLILRF